MLAKKLECNTTHTNGAFEIIRSILAETPTTSPIPQIVPDTLDELLKWVSECEGTVGDRERRLRQATLFHKLILVCKGEEDRRIVGEYREGLENKIKGMFGKELVIDPTASLRFPYLTKYMASRQIQ